MIKHRLAAIVARNRDNFSLLSSLMFGPYVLTVLEDVKHLFGEELIYCTVVVFTSRGHLSIPLPQRCLLVRE